MTAPDILAALRAHANPVNVAGTARYGIASAGTLGVPWALRAGERACFTKDLACQLSRVRLA
jgi:hypothetical protein